MQVEMHWLVDTEVTQPLVHLVKIFSTQVRGGDYADKLTAGASADMKDLVGDVAMPYAATTSLSIRERIEEIKEYVFKLINLPTDIRAWDLTGSSEASTLMFWLDIA